MSRFTYIVERIRISSWSFFWGKCLRNYVLPDYHGHIHSMVVQELMNGNMLTCQFLDLVRLYGECVVWTQYSSCFCMHMSHDIAGLVQQHFFGLCQLSVHCLLGNGGAAERKTGEQLANNKWALLSKIRGQVCQCVGQHRKRGEATWGLWEVP